MKILRPLILLVCFTTAAGALDMPYLIYDRNNNVIKRNLISTFQDIYTRLSNITTPSGTMAELKLTTPVRAGTMYYDSTNASMVVSTGTAPGAFGLIYNGKQKPTGW